jgi:hypothetical protein
MAFDVELRNPGGGFDVLLATASGGPGDIADDIFLTDAITRTVSTGKSILDTLTVTDSVARSGTSSAVYPAAVLAKGPAGYWRLNETSGVAADNLGSVGTDGTYENGAVLGGAPLMPHDTRSVSLDGISQRVSFPYDAAYSTNAVTGVTYEFWYRGTWAGDGTATGTGGAALLGCHSSATNKRLKISLNSAGRVYTATDDQLLVSGPNPSGTVVNDGQPHHIVVTINPTFDVQIYVDSVLEVTNTTPDDFGAGGATTFYLGWHQRYNLYASGAFSDLAIYPYVLSAPQVEDNYQVGTSSGLLFSRALADAVGLSDDVDRSATSLARSVPDALSFSDIYSTSMTQSRSLPDALGAGDALARAVAAQRALSDAVSFSDTVESQMVRLVALDDSVGLTDTIARAVALSRQVPDSTGVSDAVARALSEARSISDALSTTDALARAQGGQSRTIADSLAQSDAVARSVSLPRSAADALGLADSVLGEFSITRSVEDSLSAADALARSTALARGIADPLAAADSVARSLAVPRAMADALVLTESMVGTIAVTRALAEALSVADAASRSVALARALSESVGLSESLLRSLAASRSIGDSASLSDSAQTAFTMARALSDAAALIDDVTAITVTARSIEDALVLVDTMLAEFTPAVVEVFTGRQAIFVISVDTAPPTIAIDGTIRSEGREDLVFEVESSEGIGYRTYRLIDAAGTEMRLGGQPLSPTAERVTAPSEMLANGVARFEVTIADPVGNVATATHRVTVIVPEPYILEVEESGTMVLAAEAVPTYVFETGLGPVFLSEHVTQPVYAMES